MKLTKTKKIIISIAALLIIAAGTSGGYLIYKKATTPNLDGVYSYHVKNGWNYTKYEQAVKTGKAKEGDYNDTYDYDIKINIKGDKAELSTKYKADEPHIYSYVLSKDHKYLTGQYSSWGKVKKFKLPISLTGAPGKNLLIQGYLKSIAFEFDGHVLYRQ